MPLTSRTQREPVLVRAAAAEVVGTAPSSTALLADFEQTSGHVSANRTALGPGQDGPPPHYHSTSAELFFMISGTLRVLAGDRIEALSGGDLLIVPPGMTHAWATPKDTAADVLIVFTPGIERFEYFRMVERVRNEQTNPLEILNAAERFDNHFTTSPLWPSMNLGTGSSAGRSS